MLVRLTQQDWLFCSEEMRPWFWFRQSYQQIFQKMKNINQDILEKLCFFITGILRDITQYTTVCVSAPFVLFGIFENVAVRSGIWATAIPILQCLFHERLLIGIYILDIVVLYTWNISSKFSCLPSFPWNTLNIFPNNYLLYYIYLLILCKCT